MSRAYNARRKAKRQAQADAESARPRRLESSSRRLMALVPILLIVAIFAVVGLLGFGAGEGVSKKQIQQEVAELVDGIPQEGAVLGSPKAPITVWVYADLECPTVKIFVERYLPSIIDTWVRTGVAKLDYRSLRTDTVDEEVFFKQEIAALGAGRQNRMWNFLLTFVRQQGEVRTDYVNERFLVDIASQVSGLELTQWRRDRNDALLSKRVALGVYSGHSSGFRATPSFLVGFTKGEVDRRADRASVKRELEDSLTREVESLQKEALEEFPVVKTADPDVFGG